jgi:hypothetical protein
MAEGSCASSEVIAIAKSGRIGFAKRLADANRAGGRGLVVSDYDVDDKADLVQLIDAEKGFGSNLGEVAYS